MGAEAVAMEMNRPQPRSTGSNEAIFFTAVLLAFTLLLLVSTFGLRPSSAMVPRLVGVPTAVLLGYRLIREMVLRSPRRTADPERQPRTPDEIGAIWWLLALPALSTILGFVVGPALYVSIWARYRACERWVVAVAAAVLTAAGIFILFTLLLGSPLWQGLLGAWV
jgi:hypothetical protein